MSAVLSFPTLERRARPRYPLSLPVSFLSPANSTGRLGKLSALSLVGWTVNISSSGILIKIAAPLEPRSVVRLEIAWPARLWGRLPMVLRVRARVVWVEDGRAAVQIIHREFRVKGNGPKVKN